MGFASFEMVAIWRGERMAAPSQEKIGAHSRQSCAAPARQRSPPVRLGMEALWPHYWASTQQPPAKVPVITA